VEFKNSDASALSLKPDSLLTINKYYPQDGWYRLWYLGHKYLFEKHFGVFPEDDLLHIEDSLKKRSCLMNGYEGTISPKKIHIKVTGYCPPKNEDMIFDKVPVDPEYPGGRKAFKQYINQVLLTRLIPSYIQRDSAIFLRVLIKKDGRAYDPFFYDSINRELKDILSLAMTQTPLWKPAQQSGNAVHAYLEVFILVRKNGMVEADYY
jgi:hypothetical protein